ncbi:hypothetical protein MNBD_NITROSPINAE02-1770 [hydrothermal vent metagenome]|uniref:Radical SAM core domain-containing protein n=1 Tax=hydrothermal vent metagenome TaxID=652676 RepID=A0A3B1CM61_9ZZZZ
MSSLSEIIKKPVRKALLFMRDRGAYNKELNRRKTMDAIGKKKFIHYVPPNFTVYITFKCNLRCDGCNFLLNDENAFEGGGFMEFEFFEKLLKRYQNQVTNLTPCGGEATLHPRFVDMMKLASSLDYKLTLFTNGSNLIKVKEALPLFKKLSISMDSYDYDTFNKNRGGTRKLYDQILEGIQWLNDNGIKFFVSYVLSRERLDEAEKFLKFAKSVNASSVNFHSMSPHGDDSIDTLKLEYPDVKLFYKQMISEKKHPFDITLPHPVPEDQEVFANAKCPKLWKNAYIYETGDISYCCHLKADPAIGNIGKGYNFNSEKMVRFRADMIDHGQEMRDCVLCQRRFDSIEAKATYSKEAGRWTKIPSYLDGIAQTS